MLIAPFADVLAETEQTPQQPNIIVILTDDQGYDDVSFNGSKDIRTPHIDRIANEGVRFDQGYVSFPVCGPSRAGLITGRYQSRFGFELNPSENPDDPKAGLPTSEKTIAEVLKPAGYTSTVIGKWHLGSHSTFHPLARGFDEFYGFLNGGHNYYAGKYRDIDARSVQRSGALYNSLLVRNREKIKATGYLTDLLSDEALSFIDRNKAQPFFIYLSYNAPHAPVQAPARYTDRFVHIKDDKRRTYAGMIAAVDDGVGHILDRLEEHGIAENTLVFFLSDNGGPLKKAANGSSNRPLRGGKGDLFEGGVRVPYALKWPGKAPAGVAYPNMVSSLDILATIVAAADIDVSDNKPLDGVDLVPFLQDRNFTQHPHEALFWRYRRSNANVYDKKAMVSGDTKYVQLNKNPMLFDLSCDISEQNNLHSEQKDISMVSKVAIEAWEQSMIDLDISIFNQWPEKIKPAKGKAK